MTDIALRDYLERLILELDRRYEQRFKASDQALIKAETDLAEYKRGSNEWRDALKDMANRLATKDDFGKLESIVHELRRDKANLDGRMAIIGAMAALIVSAVMWLVIGK